MIAEGTLTLGLAVPPSPPITDLFRSVDLAEDLGLDVWSTWDHVAEFGPPIGSHDTPAASFEFQVLLGVLAGRASTVRLAIGVTELLRRHPVIVAQAFLTLAHAARRTPILAVGAGERFNTQACGIAFDRPVARLEEGLQVLRDCVDGDAPLTFEGSAFALDAAPFPLRAPIGRIPPIWVGGKGPRLCRLAGRFGDGWYPADIADPAAYAEGLQRVRAAATAAGRDPAAITPAAELIVLAVDDAEDLPALFASDDARLTGLLLPADAWRDAGFEHPLGEGFRGFVDYDPVRADESALAAVPPNLVARYVLAGTPDAITRRLEDLHAAGLRHANLAFGSLAEERSRRRVGDVVRAIRRRMGRKGRS